MAAGKKKSRKPAANPARGFATVSSASKPRPVVEDDSKIDPGSGSIDTSKGSVPGSGNGVISTTPQASSNGDSRAGDAHVPTDAAKPELTPEEYEKELEESALQILVEKHGPKCRRDVVRQSDRLRTERRILRAQSMPLDISSWISKDLFDVIAQRCTGTQDQDVQKQRAKPLGDSPSWTEELTIRIWTLKKILAALGFGPTQTEDALSGLIRENAILGPQAFEASNSYWGLDFCLFWLARNVPKDDLLDYENELSMRPPKPSKEELLEETRRAQGQCMGHRVNCR